MKDLKNLEENFYGEVLDQLQLLIKIAIKGFIALILALVVAKFFTDGILPLWNWFVPAIFEIKTESQMIYMVYNCIFISFFFVIFSKLNSHKTLRKSAN